MAYLATLVLSDLVVYRLRLFEIHVVVSIYYGYRLCPFVFLVVHRAILVALSTNSVVGFCVVSAGGYSDLFLSFVIHKELPDDRSYGQNVYLRAKILIKNVLL